MQVKCTTVTYHDPDRILFQQGRVYECNRVEKGVVFALMSEDGDCDNYPLMGHVWQFEEVRV